MSIKHYLHTHFHQAVLYNVKNIQTLLERNDRATYADLGCSDGKLTLMFAKKIRAKKVLGIDISQADLYKAKRKGILVYTSDLNQKFPLSNNSIDVITAHQVIEHLTDSDMFVREIHRVLKPGGYAVVSTENASSWCNICASVMGWQIFSLTNFSGMKRSIGNPLSIHRDDVNEYKSWRHVRIYNILGLKEYFKISGFRVEKVMCAGYFPFPAWFGSIDPIHAHFITFKIRKKHG